MHDVVGHSLAVITLQAGVAEHLLQTRPHEARRAIAAIRDVSKEALAELRTELAVLRDASPANGERMPTPGVRDLPDLVERMRAAGLDVGLENDGDAGKIPDIVAAAAYRIAQESLTNVVRHAGPGAHARVRTLRGDTGIEIEVIDDGTGSQNGAEGDGISGMRERVTALGGDFSAGSRPGGGFRVWASLPLSQR
jgi:signal transduction histidine kinase